MPIIPLLTNKGSGVVAAADKAFGMGPDLCVFAGNVVQFSTIEITGDDLDPAHIIQGRLVGWLNNTPRIRTYKSET
jgi:hypothetical protein